MSQRSQKPSQPSSRQQRPKKNEEPNEEPERKEEPNEEEDEQVAEEEVPSSAEETLYGGGRGPAEGAEATAAKTMSITRIHVQKPVLDLLPDEHDDRSPVSYADAIVNLELANGRTTSTS